MQQVDMETIKSKCETGTLRWTNHIIIRLLQRGITTDDVEAVLTNGEIIEQYPDDYPNPSCLVLGLTISDGALHVVCGLSETELWLITAYHPSVEEWSADFRTRRRSEL